MVQDAIPMTVPAYWPRLAEALESSLPPSVFLIQECRDRGRMFIETKDTTGVFHYRSVNDQILSVVAFSFHQKMS